jgi:hypothetical protein
VKFVTPLKTCAKPSDLDDLMNMVDLNIFAARIVTALQNGPYHRAEEVWQDAYHELCAFYREHACMTTKELGDRIEIAAAAHRSANRLGFPRMPEKLLEAIHESVWGAGNGK